MMDKERQEAIDAGERALDSLYAARNELSSAGNWGLVDMLGGGIISTFIKRSKMDNARQHMERAKYDLQAFSREVSDVSQYMNVDTGDLLSFADYFFDGFLADILVQQKIGDAKRQVDDAIYRVERILSEIRNSLHS